MTLNFCHEPIKQNLIRKENMREDYRALMKTRPELFKDGLIHIVTDEKIIREFEEETGRTIGIIYVSPYNMMVVDLVYIEEGKYFAYERLIPAVA